MRTTILLGVIIAGLFSCSKSDDDSGKHTESVKEVEVHVVGYETNGTKDVAQYWKNGTPVVLSDGTYDSRATSLFITDNNDVFVGGIEDNGTYYIVKYWENGNPTLVTNGTTAAAVNSIYVDNNDVYVAGHENWFAKYWVNGKPVGSLTDYKSTVNDIVIFAGNVYAAGNEYNGSKQVAKYWKNSGPSR